MRCCTPLSLSGRLHFLDALRGIAALGVMLFHFYGDGVSPLHARLASTVPGWLDTVIERWDCGVDIFFVLSGFVIAYSMDRQVTHLRYAGNFIVRRSLRLDPPYWTACALMIGYFLLRWPEDASAFYEMFGGVRGILANLFYVQDLQFIYPAKSIIDVAWTLCLEVQFYLCLLLILVVAHYLSRLTPRRASHIRHTFIVLAVGTIWVCSCICRVSHNDGIFADRAWTFFIGVIVYVALTRGAPASLMLILMGALQVFWIWRQDAHSIATVVTAIAIYTVGIRQKLGSCLAWRPLLYLGKISYSIYLLHMVFGMNLLNWLGALGVQSALSAWISFVAACALSLGAAHLLHILVEAPSNRLSQRLKRRKPAPSKSEETEELQLTPA